MKINKKGNYFNLSKRNTKIERIDLYKIIKINKPKEKIIYDLITNMLKERTKTLNEKDFLLKKAQFYDTTINLVNIDIKDYYLFNFSLEYISSKVSFENVKELFDDFLKNNIIDEKTLEIEKENYIVKINDLKNSLQDVAYNVLLTKILPNYYLSYDEIIKLLKEISLKDINEFMNILSEEKFVFEINYNLDNLNYNLEEKVIKSNVIYDQKEEIIEEKNNNEQMNYYMVFELKKEYSDIQKQLFNEYFGANVNSKLFSIIREQKHLCYSVYSRFITKNILIVFVGLDPLKDNECKEEIIKIINNINSEKINVDIFKKQLINKYEQNQDKYFFHKKLIENHIINNEDYEINEIIKKIKNLSTENIKDISNNLKLIKEIKIS